MQVLKFSLADCHTVVCVSHTSKENTVLRACVPPHRVCVIPNGAPRCSPRHPAASQGFDCPKLRPS